MKQKLRRLLFWRVYKAIPWNLQKLSIVEAINHLVKSHQYVSKQRDEAIKTAEINGFKHVAKWKNALDLLEYLERENKDGITEFRLKFENETKLYCHPMNRDGETFDLTLSDAKLKQGK